MKRRIFAVILAVCLVMGLAACSGQSKETEAPKTETENATEKETGAPETDAPETEGAGTEAPETEAPESETEEAKGPQDIVILYTSDVHCGMGDNFGYAGLEAIKEHFENAGDKVFLVDDGDAIQGDHVGTLTQGEAIIDLMNKAGYDVAIPGNHEFDYGMDRFLELVDKAEYQYISCNFNKSGELVLDPYVIKEAGDHKIAFVGVTTPKTLTSSTPKYFMDENGEFIYGFFQDETGEGVYNAVQKAVDDARGEGADIVVVMGHMGLELDCSPWTYAEVIENTNGIDVFLDGHSHDTEQVVMKNKDGEDVIRSACGTKLAGIGWVRISAEDGSITSGLYSWNNGVPAYELFDIDNDMAKEVAAKNAELGDKLNEVVAVTNVDLTIYDPEAVDAEGHPVRVIRVAETNLGDLCADAYRDQSGADIAFVNGGGIRTSIEKGDITFGDIINVHPFGNMLTVIEVTGQQILDALEWGTRNVPGENGGFPQVSGLTYEIHSYIDSSCTSDENGLFTGVTGEYRVKNVKVGGEDLDLTKTYTLASHDYMLLNKGDGYNMFNDCKVLQESVKLDNQVLIDYITGTLGGQIGEGYEDPYGQGRIVIFEEAPAN